MDTVVRLAMALSALLHLEVAAVSTMHAVMTTNTAEPDANRSTESVTRYQ